MAQHKGSSTGVSVLLASGDALLIRQICQTAVAKVDATGGLDCVADDLAQNSVAFVCLRSPESINFSELTCQHPIESDLANTSASDYPHTLQSRARWTSIKAIQTIGIDMRRIFQTLIFAALAILTIPVIANTFEEDLEQVDYALKKNPSGALQQSLESCLKARNHAYTLNKMGAEERARRALQYCFDSLRISNVKVVRVAAITQEELQTKANLEYDKALGLAPDVANGLAIYRECAACHQPEGWGYTTGSVPQIAGQHRKVVIKQLADYRAANRDSVLMAPYATVESIGGAQALTDVAEYISTLEISIENGKGPGTDLELGKDLYSKHCMDCHGENGEGSNDDLSPRIQAQHYKYLVRQFQWIRDGKRRNASAEMTSLSQQFDDSEISALLDYVSRLQPAEELRAPTNWKNPDFE